MTSSHKCRGRLRRAGPASCRRNEQKRCADNLPELAGNVNSGIGHQKSAGIADKGQNKHFQFSLLTYQMLRTMCIIFTLSTQKTKLRDQARSSGSIGVNPLSNPAGQFFKRFSSFMPAAASHQLATISHQVAGRVATDYPRRVTSNYKLLQLRSNICVRLPPRKTAVLGDDANLEMLGAHLKRCISAKTS